MGKVVGGLGSILGDILPFKDGGLVAMRRGGRVSKPKTKRKTATKPKTKRRVKK